MSGFRHIGLLGFGEVGQIVAADLAARGATGIAAWDILFPDPHSVPARALASTPIRAATGAGDAVDGADLVISAVTAGQCLAAAESAAPALQRGAVYLDLNSVSPATRVEASAAIEARGARYVEAAVMSPIGPKRLASPMLLGGPHAAELLPSLHALGLTGASAFATVIGRASAAKMCRSVVVKGVEALLGEAMLAARHYRVDATVLDSLGDLFPGLDWRRLGRYMISRSLQHGRRRSEEMREVARTVADAGIGNWMASATAERQDWAAAHAAALAHDELVPLLDAILAEVASSSRATKP
jgi:3-hydroxyisobutyrate dehydrogenase-like beta-hydroxyacid dehydrogenase